MSDLPMRPDLVPSASTFPTSRRGAAGTAAPPPPPSGADWLRATDSAPEAFWPVVRWSLAFVALLAYLHVIVTYRFPIGDFAMGAALIGLAFEPKGVRWSGFWLLMVGLLLWAALGYLVSPWPWAVVNSLETLWKLVLIMLVVVTALNDRSRIRVFLLAFVLFYAMYPARGAIFNYFLGGYTIFGRAVWNHIYRNPNDLAALTLLALSMASGLLVTERNRLIRKAALAAVVVLSLVVLLTQSRGAFVGLAVFGLFALMGQRSKARVIAMVCVVLVGAVLLLPDTAWSRFGMVAQIGRQGSESLSTLDDKGSAEQRFAIWRTAVRIIKDHPVTGVGLGAYGPANARYSPELGGRDTHSTYLNVLAEQGVPGLLLLFTLIASVVIPAERVRRKLKDLRPHSARQLLLLELGLLAFLVAGIFASYARLTFFYLHLAVIWALARAHQQEMRRALHPSPRPGVR
jgi:probable O-glycosylation ligase (exosortase A-associated)